MLAVLVPFSSPARSRSTDASYQRGIEDANASQGFRVCPRTSKEFGNTGGEGALKPSSSKSPRAQLRESRVSAEKRVKYFAARLALFAAIPMRRSR